MDVFRLPRDIFGAGAPPEGSLIFHHYRTSEPAFKGRSILETSAVSLVISGSKTMSFADRTVKVNDTEIHLLSRGNCLVTMDLPEGRWFESVLIFFDDGLLVSFYERHANLIEAARARLRDAARTIASNPYLPIPKDAFIKNFISSLLMLTATPGGMTDAMKALKFEELMLYLLDAYPDAFLSFPIAKRVDLDDLAMRRAVEMNAGSNIGLEELAFLCNMSLSTFKRRFIQLYGISPGKWLIQKKMERARDLIQRGGTRPGEVYHRLGYQDHSSFSQAYRQYFGESPKDSARSI